MIRFDHATKRYPDGTVAVDDLVLEAPSGKITVLVGPSGCGKTTSLRMINRMIEPTSGTIWLDDTDTASMPAHELRRQIGYVIQHAGLFPHRTIVDNIATVPFLLGTGHARWSSSSVSVSTPRSPVDIPRSSPVASSSASASLGHWLPTHP
jgi:osmoprotectant transport system ATP-binding protein